MKYYPIAIVSYGSNPFCLHTTDSCSTIEDAKAVIKDWRKQYTVYSAWIHDEDNGIKVFEVYVDILGNVRKPKN